MAYFRGKVSEPRLIDGKVVHVAVDAVCVYCRDRERGFGGTEYLFSGSCSAAEQDSWTTCSVCGGVHYAFPAPGNPAGETKGERYEDA